MMKIDNLDLEIIKHLQEDGRLSYRELGRKLDIPHTTVFTRAERLVKNGVIKNFSSILHPHDLGLRLGFILVDTHPSKSKEIAEQISSYEEVRKVFRTFDGKIIAKIVVPNDDHEGWENFMERLEGLPVAAYPIYDVVKFEHNIPDTILKSTRHYVDK